MSASEPLPPFDLYRELGVPPWADRVTIEAAYRTLMKIHHPDVASDPGVGLERGKRLNIARQWLTDPERRRRFDQSLGLGWRARPPCEGGDPRSVVRVSHATHNQAGSAAPRSFRRNSSSWTQVSCRAHLN